MHSDESAVPIPQSVVISVLVMTSAFLLSGMFGNALVFLLIARRSDLRKVPHFLFVNLSVIGLCSSLFVMPFIISIAVTAYVMDHLESMEIFCNVRLFFSFLCSAINALTLSLMAVDRQDCVFRPFKRRIQKRNVQNVLLTIWAVVIIISVIFVLVLATDGSQCPHSDPFNLGSSSSNSGSLFSIYVTAFGTGFNVAAILVIVITFVRIVKRLRSSPLPESRTPRLRFESEITKLTYKTCAIFILSWFPVIISHTIARFSDTTGLEKIRILKLITLTFTNFTYVANPFLHYKLLKTRQPLTSQHKFQLISKRRTESST